MLVGFSGVPVAKMRFDVRHSCKMKRNRIVWRSLKITLLSYEIGMEWVWNGWEPRTQPMHRRFGRNPASRIKTAGLLTHRYGKQHLPSIFTSGCLAAVACTHLQWRDRTGFAPVSLLADNACVSEPFESNRIPMQGNCQESALLYNQSNHKTKNPHYQNLPQPLWGLHVF